MFPRKVGKLGRSCKNSSNISDTPTWKRPDLASDNIAAGTCIHIIANNFLHYLMGHVKNLKDVPDRYYIHKLRTASNGKVCIYVL
jgi:hypothetical protein